MAAHELLLVRLSAELDLRQRSSDTHLDRLVTGRFTIVYRVVFTPFELPFVLSKLVHRRRCFSLPLREQQGHRFPLLECQQQCLVLAYLENAPTLPRLSRVLDLNNIVFLPHYSGRQILPLNLLHLARHFRKGIRRAKESDWHSLPRLPKKPALNHHFV